MGQSQILNERTSPTGTLRPVAIWRLCSSDQQAENRIWVHSTSASTSWYNWTALSNENTMTTPNFNMIKGWHNSRVWCASYACILLHTKNSIIHTTYHMVHNNIQKLNSFWLRQNGICTMKIICTQNWRSTTETCLHSINSVWMLRYKLF